MPWFCGPEYNTLLNALTDAEVVAAAIELDAVATVGSAQTETKPAELLQCISAQMYKVIDMQEV
jgi:hypothetical protein